MRKVRWIVEFKTIKEKAASVFIYEEAWTGKITSLQAAENAISMSEDDAEGMMSPIRTQTG